ncbi:MAG: aroK [Acidimicrobiales bacterium]|nr:aroK [Acidimicrobiales bacterium]
MADGSGPVAGGAPADHVVLVGLMGAGKTTVGKKVAKLLGRPFVDADAALEARTGRSVRDWFALDGEAGFRTAEAEVMADLLASSEPTVVAAGGGAVVTPSTRERLAGGGVFVVWLYAEPDFLADRVARKEHRPLLDEDPHVVLHRLFAERVPLYREVADLTLDIRPAHEAGTKPKWNLAQQVAAAVVAHDAGRDPAAAASSIRHARTIDGADGALDDAAVDDAAVDDVAGAGR